MTTNEGIDWPAKLAERNEGTFWDDLGLRAVEVTEERTVLALDAGQRHLNPMGIVHGGVLSSLIDNAMGVAVLREQPDRRAVTTNLNIHFVAALGPGTLTATATVLHRSRSTVTVQASIAGPDGRTATLGTGSFRLLD